MVDFPDRQLGPSDKITFSPFSYAKAIIKDDVTYPIVPNCPIIYTDNNGSFGCGNIPVGTFLIVHRPRYDTPGDGGRVERLFLRVQDEVNEGYLAMPGLIDILGRGYENNGGDVNEVSAQ